MCLQEAAGGRGAEVCGPKNLGHGGFVVIDWNFWYSTDFSLFPPVNTHHYVCLCRLRLSPSPPPTVVTGSRSSTSAAHSRSIHCSAQSSPAKRRRPNDTDSEASSFTGGAVARTRITQQASASGRVTVDEVDLDGKYVRLSNKADEVREWTLSSFLKLSRSHRNNIAPCRSSSLWNYYFDTCRIRIWRTGRWRGRWDPVHLSSSSFQLNSRWRLVRGSR